MYTDKLTLRHALGRATRPLLLAITVIAFFASTGCKKKSNDLTSNTYSALDHTQADNELTNVFNMADDQARNGSNKNASGSLIPSCATVTIDTLAQNNVDITIDFGTTNCLCYDGARRRGKVFLSLNGDYLAAGSTLDVRVQDYYVNDNKVEGTKKITNLGNSTGNWRYKDETRNVTITTTNGIITWQADKIIERTAGSGTLTPFDDIYTVNGTASGINRLGDAYTVEVAPTTPLKRVIKLGCQFFLAGIITLKTGGSQFVVNFDPIGGEPCDNVGALTIDNGNPIIFNMY